MTDPEIVAIFREQAVADRIHAAATVGLDTDDVALVAQYAKTYADGQVWKAACRLLAVADLHEPVCPPSAVVDQIIPWCEVQEGDLLLWDGEFRTVEHINPMDYGNPAFVLDGDRHNGTIPVGTYASVRRYTEDRPAAPASIKRSGQQERPAVPYATTDAEYAARVRMDTELARELGLERPYVMGPLAGTCPGGASYGHGMSLTTVHSHGCCERWDTARQARLAVGG